mmetsp:Transcript_34172/g.89864  ORF Transcript_34172/g.89864 Transcript_34172/m.89864 type:complete len:237 (-) Transcript_34172:712-1422(-)
MVHVSHAIHKSSMTTCACTCMCRLTDLRATGIYIAASRCACSGLRSVLSQALWPLDDPVSPSTMSTTRGKPPPPRRMELSRSTCSASALANALARCLAASASVRDMPLGGSLLAGRGFGSLTVAAIAMRRAVSEAHRFASSAADVRLPFPIDAIDPAAAAVRLPLRRKKLGETFGEVAQVLKPPMVVDGNRPLVGRFSHARWPANELPNAPARRPCCADVPRSLLADACACACACG